MSRLPRINIKLVVSAICIVAGLIILWRTFGMQQPSQVAIRPTSVATQPVTRRTTAEIAGIASPIAQPTKAALPTNPAYPIDQVTLTPIPVSSLTPLVPTAVLPTAAFQPSPSAIVAISPSPATVVAPSPSPAARPTSTIALSPTNQPPTQLTTQPPTQLTTQPTASVATIAPSPTSQPTASIATNTPTPTTIGAATPTLTLAATAAQPTPAVVTVTYTVTGVVSKAYLGYTDATGKVIDLANVSLPWSITFQAAADADLYIDVIAIPDDEQDVAISCAIQIDGSNVFYGKQLPFDQDTSANGGVTCDRSL